MDPLYLSRLLFSNGNTQDTIGRFLWIEALPRLKTIPTVSAIHTNVFLDVTNE